eukprot:g54931.t1
MPATHEKKEGNRVVARVHLPSTLAAKEKDLYRNTFIQDILRLEITICVVRFQHSQTKALSCASIFL